MDTKRFDELLAKYLTDSLDIDEQRELDSYVDHDPQAKVLFNKSRFVWARSGALAKFSKFENCKADDLCKVFARTRGNESADLTGLYIGWHRWMAAASVVLLISLTGWYLHQNVAGFGKWESMASGAQSKLVTLPDNSSVMMNKNSRIVYLANMDGEERIVKLKGEAFFDVQHLDSQSFIVEAGGADVKVLGTAFNVRLDSDNQLTEVYVQRGKVALGNGSRKIELNPSDIGRLQQGKLTKETIIDSNVLFWKTGQLVFNNNTLPEVIEALVHCFPEIVAVDVQNHDTLIRVTTRFDNPSLDEVFSELEVHLNADFDLNNGTLVVR